MGLGGGVGLGVGVWRPSGKAVASTLTPTLNLPSHRKVRGRGWGVGRTDEGGAVALEVA